MFICRDIMDIFAFSHYLIYKCLFDARLRWMWAKSPEECGMNKKKEGRTIYPLFLYMQFNFKWHSKLFCSTNNTIQFYCWWFSPNRTFGSPLRPLHVVFTSSMSKIRFCEFVPLSCYCIFFHTKCYFIQFGLMSVSVKLVRVSVPKTLCIQLMVLLHYFVSCFPLEKSIVINRSMLFFNFTEHENVKLFSFLFLQIFFLY